MIDAWTRSNLLPARAAIAAGILCGIVTMLPARADQPAGDHAGVQVVVAKATSACFSDKVHVTGFVVPRREAVVIADSDGRVTDVLVREGGVVTENQDVVRIVGAAGSRTLKAPAAGLITEVRTIAGAPASPLAGPMLRIAVGNELEVEAEVPSIHALKVGPGATARISRDDGVELNGAVRLGAPQIDRKTQFGQVRISLVASPTLKVGMFVRVTIDARRSCGVAIPRSAIDHSTVQVVKDSVVETRPVKIGLVSDNAIEILEGVREGETVVADAGTSLHDGDRIKPIFPDDSERSKAR
ncbi:CusB/HlyD membrane fusion family barrel-sandwich protein [Rhodopseudomonas thermotolerans]|uniref:CusB/HlyD membrane fusion family barrel-sandwich protein n=2 Tax=Rhodopseudomonas TaxID=1073 RepID=A0A336JIV3_9BRAD|nr:MULTISPECIES: efflux RND transporter periplasmic adaptor subunit [Rhodopseudomonas]RED38835.1 CusB/HlyD membrane fusion family barrel-sandwich protein [Rhodopseudomonas pentothenatexigens]REG06906.1 CusB/HlyD membrane fusion family barrel-sandwich protein [Rhodopseudomonas thermotolerans]SSW89655.1 CusB/HlyD membrane fusion family barrel-sandwich protein [Rhodopseudomonas pentothenatexigens]